MRANEKEFVSKAGSGFYSTFVQEAAEFAKEIFEDPTTSGNPFVGLPTLTRETYFQKGVFYRTEKVLVQSHSHCF